MQVGVSCEWASKQKFGVFMSGGKSSCGNGLAEWNIIPNFSRLTNSLYLMNSANGLG